MKENGERRKQRRNCHPLSVFQSEVIDTNLDSSLYTAQSKGNYKKKLKLKLLQGLK